MRNYRLLLKQIVLKELADHFKGYKFSIVFISCFTLMGFNHLVMYQNYKSRLLDVELASTTTTSSFNFIVKKAEPLSVYVTGVGDLINRVLTFDDKVTPRFLADLQGINFDVHKQYFPLIDFNYLVCVILSFLAMIVGFDAICGEKQNGTLKLMLSNTVPKDTVLFGKLISNFLTLIIPFIFSSLFYYIVLTTKKDLYFTSSDNIRLLLMMLVSVIYLSVFIIISITISASSSNIVESMIKNFIVWATIVFFIPAVSPSLSDLSGKLPEGRKIEDAYLINLIDKNSSMQPEEAFYNYTSQVLDYRNKLNKQIRTIELTALLIPSNAYNLCVTSLAKCGLEDEEDFRNAILQYHKDRFNGKNNYDFVYEGLDLKSSLQNSLKYFGSLLIFMLAMFLIAVKKFNNYDIR